MDLGPLHSRFELVDTARNCRRFYALALVEDRQLTFKGGASGLVLVISRGRIGGKSITRRERFASSTRAIERWGELAGRRRRHGYVEVT